eukprot:Lankesteria_metandrocarpae@DN8528_c0_g1_i1.p1
MYGASTGTLAAPPPPLVVGAGVVGSPFPPTGVCFNICEVVMEGDNYKDAVVYMGEEVLKRFVQGIIGKAVSDKYTIAGSLSRSIDSTHDQQLGTSDSTSTTVAGTGTASVESDATSTTVHRVGLRLPRMYLWDVYQLGYRTMIENTVRANVARLAPPVSSPPPVANRGTIRSTKILVMGIGNATADVTEDEMSALTVFQEALERSLDRYTPANTTAITAASVGGGIVVEGSDGSSDVSSGAPAISTNIPHRHDPFVSWMLKTIDIAFAVNVLRENRLKLRLDAFNSRRMIKQTQVTAGNATCTTGTAACQDASLYVNDTDMTKNGETHAAS